MNENLKLEELEYFEVKKLLIKIKLKELWKKMVD
jgi:hypothetical protein